MAANNIEARATFPNVLGSLNDESHEAVVMALGEALRIGCVWLGVEFLLMGLSRQTGRPLFDILKNLEITPSHFRGELRQAAGLTINGTYWRDWDVVEGGRFVFNMLARASVGCSRSATEDQHPWIVTPRVVDVFATAAVSSGAEHFGHRHLLLALLQHQNCPPVRLLFDLAESKGWTSEHVLRWVGSPQNLPQNEQNGYCSV